MQLISIVFWWRYACYRLAGLAGEIFRLVYRLLNPWGFAVRQLAVFQGASEGPVSGSYRSSEQRGKTANWPRPGGLG